MKLPVCLTLVLAGCLTLACPVSAEVFKWVDENGRVHYGDRPVPGSAEQVDIQIAPENKPGSNPKSREEMRKRLLDSMEEDRLERKKARMKEQAARERNAYYCERYRRNLQQLNTKIRLFVVNENGEREYISDKERETRLKKNRAMVKKYCR